jgi:hypothetical protein
MTLRIPLAAALVAAALPLAANDVIFLHGQVEMADGSAPGKTVEIQLSCGGAEPSRQTVTNKKGAYNLRVERDDFNHIARALPTTTTDIGSGGAGGSCLLLAALKGYTSNRIDLGSYTIGQDLTLPKLVLRAASH